MSMLQYPIEETSRMNENSPWVMFTPYEYELPKAVLKESTVARKQDGPIISLYVPPDVSENFGANWNNENLINVNDLSNSVASRLTKMATQGTGMIGGSITGATGYTSMPTEMKIFQSPKQPTLNMRFELVPRTQAESEEIYYIVNAFKMLSLPTLSEDSAAVEKKIKEADGGVEKPAAEPTKSADTKQEQTPAAKPSDTSIMGKIATQASKTFLKFPHIWDIEFQNLCGPGIPTSIGSNEWTYPNMALTSVDVTYSGGAASMLTYTANGDPVKISLGLTFEALAYAIGGGS